MTERHEWVEWDFPEGDGASRRMPRRQRASPRAEIARQQRVVDLQVRGTRGAWPARRRSLRYHILAGLVAAIRIAIGAVCGLILAGVIWFAVTFITKLV
jgi:hypothetical protein